MRSLAFVAVAACTPAAYAPPARMTPLDTPSGPAAGGTDVQGEVGRVGTLWGPSLGDGDLRARHALDDRVVIEGETGVAAVTNAGRVVPGAPSTSTSRDGYTGRAGVIVQGVDGAVRGALTAGVGGGYSKVAGGWTSVDVGAGFGGTHPWIRPWFNGEISVNRPVSDRRFTVAYGDHDQETLALESNEMIRGTLGIELGPIDRAFVVGLSVTKIIADSNGALGADRGSADDGFVGIAAGFRARL